MTQTVDSLPSYLRQYVARQTGDSYTTRDHAAWRYIMRQARDYFKEHAVPVYLEGLGRTGITLDRIPLVSAMDAKMREIGWGAVPVRGFLPPSAFLDFQARRILPIAADMRTVEHIHYTPAPDIVHEAAGHAPILADEDYAQYLTKYAAMAQKAVFTHEDLDVYEAIRALSDVKENPDSMPSAVAIVEAALRRATAANVTLSESAKVARMNWWTVEYGLVGPLSAPKIYGAGLLSSVGESRECLSAKVRKLPLSLACIDTAYDITEPQPQLFVAESLAHMTEVLSEFEATLAFRRGGLYGLGEAKRARTVTTTVLDSGLEVSGVLSDFVAAGESAIFLRLSGPVQLAVVGTELAGQGVAHHPQGFSSPLGRVQGLTDRPAAQLTDADLAKVGAPVGQRGELTVSGYVVRGELVRAERAGGKLVLLKWRDCTVKRGDEVLFRPEWGDFDMAIGERVVSVHGGPADRERYGAYEVGQAQTTPGRTSPFTEQERSAFEAYGDVRRMRDALATGNFAARAQITALADDVARRFPGEWLLRLEAIELVARFATDAAGASRAKALALSLEKAAEALPTPVPWLVASGLKLAGAAE